MNIKEILLKLDNYSTFYKKDKKYLILFIYETQQQALLLRVYNNDAIWIQQLKENDFEQMRQKSDIKGTFQSFIEMIIQSLDNNNYQLQVQDLNLKILFEFQLSQGVFIKSQLDLGGGLLIEDNESKQVQSQFTFDLYESMKQKYILLRNQKDQEIKQITNISKEKEQQKIQIPTQETKEEQPKRKVNGDIVMPNKKKRKAIGAKLE